MNKILIIIVVVIAIFIFCKCVFKSKSEFNNSVRPDISHKPTQLVDNDKIVIIKEEKLDDVQNAIQSFCNAYNKEKFLALPRLYVFDKEYVITFPYDIDFVTLCYFVNYMRYSQEPPHKVDVLAWCSISPNDEWTNTDIVNKKVMLFVPEFDKDFDNVYLTSNDNIGYKMGFAVGEISKKLDSPVLAYSENDIDLSKSIKHIDFE